MIEEEVNLLQFGSPVSTTCQPGDVKLGFRLQVSTGSEGMTVQ